MTDIEFHDAALVELLESQDGPVGRDLHRRALQVEASMVEHLSRPGTGRIYRRKGRVHQASAPGEPPAVDTGLLRASVRSSVGRDERGLVATIGTNQKVGVYLELGTRYMAPRPFARPALDAARE